MNTRSANGSTAIARNGLGTGLVALLRALSRAPLASQSVPIAGAFLCSCLLYGCIADHCTVPGWSLLGGVATFFALFVQLRLIDDLDDLDRDYPAGQCTGASRSAIRARLLASLAVCAMLITLLNLDKRQALGAAAAATALAFAAPFGFKRMFPRSLAVGSLLFEGAPCLIFAYCYFFWRDAGGAALPFAAAASVTGLFWTGYEFWKFSRKVHTSAMQPYFLSPRGIRAALNALLVLALIANLALARFAGLSEIYTTYALALPLAWLMWLNASWPGADGESKGMRRPLWAGMSFVGALELGLLVELLSMTGSK